MIPLLLFSIDITSFFLCALFSNFRPDSPGTNIHVYSSRVGQGSGRVGLAHAITSHPEGTSKILGMEGTLIFLKMHTHAEPQTLRNAHRVKRFGIAGFTEAGLPLEWSPFLLLLLLLVVQFTNEIAIQMHAARYWLDFVRRTGWFLNRSSMNYSYTELTFQDDDFNFPFEFNARMEFKAKTKALV